MISNYLLSSFIVTFRTELSWQARLTTISCDSHFLDFFSLRLYLNSFINLKPGPVVRKENFNSDDDSHLISHDIVLVLTILLYDTNCYPCWRRSFISVKSVEAFLEWDTTSQPNFVFICFAEANFQFAPSHINRTEVADRISRRFSVR